MADIFVNGEELGHCQDFLCDCPEDAVWARDLEDIFWLGVKAGRLTKQNSEIEVKNLKEW